MFVNLLNKIFHPILKLNLFLFLLVITNQCYAAIRPSFSLNECTWRATDIVIASKGNIIDENVIVDSVLKGTLTPGQSLSLPELSDISKNLLQKPNTQWNDFINYNEDISGQRMILFLINASSFNSEKVKFIPAAAFGGMAVSVVWIEKNKPYAFQQIINPGLSILNSYRESEETLKKEILALKETQDALRQIAYEPYPEKRAAKVSPYTQSNIYFAREEAVRILSDCRNYGIPVLESMLDDKTNLNLYSKIRDALFKVNDNEGTYIDQEKEWRDNISIYISENKLSEKEALKLWQEILDSNPPKSQEIFVRLMMSAPRTAPYNSGLSTESFREGAAPWLEQMIQNFKDYNNHEGIMLARIQLGKLYCSGDFNIADFEKAEMLWWEVLSVPEEEIVFDNPWYTNLNLDSIAQARGQVSIRGLPEDETQRQALIKQAHEVVDPKHRELLLKERQQKINSLRLGAIEQLTYGLVEPEIRRRTRQRLVYLQQQRPDDSFYQETVNNFIAKL